MVFNTAAKTFLYQRTSVFRPLLSTGRHFHCKQTQMAKEPFPPPARRFDTAAMKILDAAIDAVLPHNMVQKSLSVVGNTMVAGNKTYNIEKGIYVVGFGKAVLGMLKAAEDILGDKIIGGIVSVPVGSAESLRKAGKSDLIPSPYCKVKIIEGAANNFPDESAYRAAREIEELAQSLTEEDLLLTLISGGGSALLPYPAAPVTLEEMAIVTKLLSNHGASIQELNTMRKHLEVLKGGGLARVADPAEMVSLIVSDVFGDDLEYIASGPTVPDLVMASQTKSLLKQLGVESQVPQSVLKVLFEKEASFRAEHSHGLGGRFPRDNINNILIGHNQMALEAAREQAESMGFIPIILTSTLSGDVSDASVMFTKLTRFVLEKLFTSKVLRESRLPQTHPNLEVELIKSGILKHTLNDITKASHRSKNSNTPICILAGGETTVTVAGSGLGGRNQHMALDYAIQLEKTLASSSRHEFSPLFVSCGTDGQDGPNDAAGAWVNSSTVRKAIEKGLDPVKSLEDNDSYTFFSSFKNGGCHIRTGLTGTNVMDIQMLLVDPIKV